jgi:hypothetical protein
MPSNKKVTEISASKVINKLEPLLKHEKITNPITKNTIKQRQKVIEIKEFKIKEKVGIE